MVLGKGYSAGNDTEVSTRSNSSSSFSGCPMASGHPRRTRSFICNRLITDTTYSLSPITEMPPSAIALPSSIISAMASSIDNPLRTVGCCRHVGRGGITPSTGRIASGAIFILNPSMEKTDVLAWLDYLMLQEEGQYHLTRMQNSKS